MSDEGPNPSYPPPPTDLVLLAPADPDEPHGEKRAREDAAAAAAYPVAGLDGTGYDASVKRRRERGRGYTRTGQACDRCKVRFAELCSYPHPSIIANVLIARLDWRPCFSDKSPGAKDTQLTVTQARKVKCDALPEGCSPCATAAVDCFVTDRVTGRTERRGYLQDLERERERMVEYIRDLESVIAVRTDLRVQPSPWTGVRYEGEGEGDGWERVGGVLVRVPGADR